ncbi:MAG: class III cytochrome C family protein [Alphaproteobacteria bacterium]|nr:class III cytochrome C family protein [Alphaproteobacteria bacterium]
MKGLAKWVVILNLAALAVLAFVYPHLMVSPGKLADGHRELTRDCFACHAPMLGPSSSRCTGCHAVKDIGILTTKGAPITDKKTKVAFHQGLMKSACVECHTEHLGIGVRHVKPRFSHQLLDATTQRDCVGCHAKPGDDLHKSVNANCGACHGTGGWKPATFDHNKFFVFDDHHGRCTTCHRTADFKQYTCYFCHEHTPAKVRAEHLEEGIQDFEKCVDCHRSADEDEAKRAWRSLRSGTPYLFAPQPEFRREKKRRDDDD